MTNTKKNFRIILSKNSRINHWKNYEEFPKYLQEESSKKLWEKELQEESLAETDEQYLEEFQDESLS